MALGMQPCLGLVMCDRFAEVGRASATGCTGQPCTDHCR